MRYKIKQTKDPEFGDEIRWLEIVKIHQVYTSKTIRIKDELGWDTEKVYYWEDVKFIDELGWDTEKVYYWEDVKFIDEEN